MFRPAGMLSCTYTFSKKDYEYYTNGNAMNIRTPAFYGKCVKNIQ